MQIIIIFEIMALCFTAFLYLSLKRNDRANLWRKLSCYAGAKAVSIETMEQNYNAYKAKMELI